MCMFQGELRGRGVADAARAARGVSGRRADGARRARRAARRAPHLQPRRAARLSL